MSDELVAQKIREIIRADTGSWFETHGKIFGKDRSKGVFKPLRNCLQTRIGKVINRFEDLNLPARLIGLKPRQKGSTTYFCAEDYARLRRKPASGVIIGGEFSQTKEAWAMMQTYQNNDAFNWGNTGEINAKDGKWSNGSRLKPETAKDALAGIAGTYQVLHCTEAARWSSYGVANASDVLANLLKCVPLLPETLVILESTAEGAAGEFYDRWLNAVDAEEFVNGTADINPGQYCRVFAAWFEFEDSSMRLTDDQKRLVEKTLDSEEEFKGEKDLIEQYGYTDEDGIKHLGRFVKDFDVWEQLAWRRYAIREECKRDRNNFERDYPHSWRTAFQKSGAMRFNQTGLSVLRKRLAQRVAEHGILEDTKERRLNWRRTEENEAKFTIFEKPIVGCRYILSVDPMTGATQTVGIDPDRHGVFVIRAGYWTNNGGWVRPSTAARVVQCRWDIDVLEDAVWKLARFYGSRRGCKIAIEMNMDRGLTELLKLRGADLYVRETFNHLEQKTTGALGFHTNSKSREVLIEGVAGAIREWDKHGDGVDIFCPHALEQFENFIVKPNGRSEAAEGWKDDDVFSIALGLQLIGHASTFVPEQFGSGLPPDLREVNTGRGVSGAYS